MCSVTGANKRTEQNNNSLRLRTIANIRSDARKHAVDPNNDDLHYNIQHDFTVEI